MRKPGRRVREGNGRWVRKESKRGRARKREKMREIYLLKSDTVL